MGRRDWFGDPMEVALVQLAADALPELPHSRRLNEIPSTRTESVFRLCINR
jgi:hypothetical protein